MDVGTETRGSTTRSELPQPRHCSMPQFPSWQELENIEPPYAGSDLKTCKLSL